VEEIKANKQAWENFQKFSPEYKRIRIAFTEGARNRPAEACVMKIEGNNNWVTLIQNAIQAKRSKPHFSFNV
jgi:hypothetical protein